MKNMKTAAVILLILTIFLGVANAAPTQEWSKRFTEGIDVMSVNQTSDGGYILAGTTPSYDALLIKTDASGNKRWSKTFMATGISIGTSAKQTIDGGYILAGYTLSSGAGENRGWLVKTDSSGNRQWQTIFTEPGDGELFSVVQARDGRYVGAGNLGTYPNYNAWLIKTYSSGGKQWSKTFGGATFDLARTVEQTRDGGYIIGGGINYKAAIIKTNSEGVQQWLKIFSDTDISIAESVQQTTDGGYIVTGDSSSYSARLIKTDSSGNRQWGKTYRIGGANLLANGAMSVRQTPDGGYIIGGKVEYDDIVSEWTKGLLIKTDSLGNKQWSMELGQEVHSVQNARNGGYIVAGIDQSYSWIAKLSSDSPTNLLKNPGFEVVSGSLPQYWVKYQTGTLAAFTYPATGRVGGKSVAIRYAAKETGKVALWQQTGIVVSPSKQYKLSGYMKLEGVTGGGVSPRYNGASLRVNWYTSTGTLIRTDLITKSGTIGWAKYEKTVTSPSNAVRATVAGDLYNAAGKVTFDDMSFVRI